MKIGVLGAGQLGAMLAKAGQKLGHTFLFCDPNPESPAAKLGEFVCADYNHHKVVEALSTTDVVTYEFENVAVEVIEKLKNVKPSKDALFVSQHRLKEKQFLKELCIKTAQFADAKEVSNFNLPLVIKTARFGYDGKGQVVVREIEQLKSNEVRELLQVESIVEELVRFHAEWSIIAVRGEDGESRFYPLSRNIHKEGILRFSWVEPEKTPSKLQKSAELVATKVLNALDYVGVLAIEFFEVDGELIVNEIAPRVHNSGHWSMNGAKTSQFENHIRAITGMPLGDSTLFLPTCMINLIGDVGDVEKLSGLKEVTVHLYGKKPRAGRKVGHINICSSELEVIVEKVADILELPIYN